MIVNRKIMNHRKQHTANFRRKTNYFQANQRKEMNDLNENENLKSLLTKWKLSKLLKKSSFKC